MLAALSVTTLGYLSGIVFGVIVLVAMVANVWLTRLRERGAR